MAIGACVLTVAPHCLRVTPESSCATSAFISVPNVTLKETPGSGVATPHPCVDGEGVEARAEVRGADQTHRPGDDEHIERSELAGERRGH